MYPSRRAAKRAVRGAARSACVAAWPSHLSRSSIGILKIDGREERFLGSFIDNAERCQRTIADDLRDHGWAAI